MHDAGYSIARLQPHLPVRGQAVWPAGMPESEKLYFSNGSDEYRSMPDMNRTSALFT